MVWAEISLGSQTDRHVFQGGTLTGVRYLHEILDPCARPYVGAIGNDFILMYGDSRPDQSIVIERYLEDLGLERMVRTTQSPDLNPVDHLWDYLGRPVAALSPPLRSLAELEQSLLHVWSSLPISVTYNLIDRMESQYRQYIQARGEDIS